MSAKKVKYARRYAKRLQAQIDREARSQRRVPWYVRPFKSWSARWLEQWERDHNSRLKRATKRMTHMLAIR